MARKRKEPQKKPEPLASADPIRIHRLAWHIMAMFAILIAGGAVYSNTFAVPFVLDDLTSIVANPLVKDFNWRFSSRIVGYASFALNYSLNGLDPEGYHLLNLLIHCAAGILLYCLVVITGRTPFFAGYSTGRPRFFPLLGLCSALLFVCHPVQTQAVTYIAQRVTSLATLFYLSALLCYILGRQAKRNVISCICFGGALVASVCAMFTKEIAVTLPAVILLYEILFFTGRGRIRWIVAAAGVAISVLLPIAILSEGKPVDSIFESIDRLTSDTGAISRSSYLFTQFRVIVTYVRLLLIPFGQNLDYDYPIYDSLLSLPVALSALLLVGIAAAAWYGAFRLSLTDDEKNRPIRLAAFGIFWFFITLSIESSIIPIRDVIFEHRLYLPSIGFLMACAALLLYLRENLAESRPALARLIIPVFAVAVAVLACAGWMRNSLWQDNLTLWEDVVRKSPGKSRGHGVLAGILSGRGRVDEAIREYRTAIRLKPDDAAAHNNLGAIYAKRKEYDLALGEYEQALRSSPGNPKIPANIGRIHLAQGRLAEAEESLQQSLRLAPDYDEALNDLGIVLFRQGNFTGAVENLKRAIRINPDNRDARENLRKAEAFLSGRTSSR